MTPRLRYAVIMAAALLLGVVGNLLFGPSPGAVTPVAPAESEWQVLGMRVPDLVSADAGWEARTPWGAAPKPVEPPPPPPPPPPVPVGVVGTGGTRHAIFLIAGTSELRLAPGGALPDGGRVLEVSAMKVTWVDGVGETHERRMFFDPAQLPGNGAVR